MNTHARRPQLLPLPDLLEVQRWMLRACLQSLELLIGQPLNLVRKGLVVPPEDRQGKVVHSGLACPALYSASASWRKSSRRPASDRKSTRLNSSHVAISYAV